jgi:hypothetical protein
MTLIQQEYARGSIVFDADYLTGGIADRSPYKAAATVTAPVTWCNTKLGYGVRCTGAGKLTYASNAALSLAGSAATWVLQGGVFQKQITAARLLSKRDASGTGWDIKLNSTTDLVLFDGTNVSVMTGNIIGKRCIAITLVSGAKPKLYLDGTYVSEGSLACTIPTNATPPPFVVSSFYSVAYVFEEVINRITILNRALPAADVSQLYQELMSERYPLRAYSFGSRISAPQDPPGCPSLLKTDFTTRLPDGRLADLSGNGWHGTVKPGFAAGPGMCGQALYANSASRTYVDFGDVTPINGASKLTVLWYGKRGASDPSELIWNKSTGATVRNYMYLATDSVRFIAGNAKTAVYSDANINVGGFVGTVFDGDAANENKVKFYLDNKPCTPTVLADFPATLPNAVGASFEFGRLSWSNSLPPPQKSDFIAVYNSALTPSQVEYVRRQIARRSTFALDMQRVPVSLANLVGPCEVPSTPFRLQAGGTWKVSEDAAGKRWFESVAGASLYSCYCPSTQAHGTFVWRMRHVAGATEWVMFISNTVNINDSTRTAYAVYMQGTALVLVQYKPAAAYTIRFTGANTIAENTEYDVAVTRSNDGTFTVLLKGGVYNKWTVAPVTSGTNPVVDANYTTSKYFACTANPMTSGSKLSQPRFFTGPMTRDQLEEHCP